jgi:hypothetical protein
MKGNRGEWSEVFALANLAITGTAPGGDAYLQKKDGSKHRILSLRLPSKFKDEGDLYRLTDDSIEIYSFDTLIASLPKSKLRTFADGLFADLSAQRETATFASEAGTNILNLLRRFSIKAPSTSTLSDIELTFESPSTGFPTPEVGFNIKSQLGAPSTLFNASRLTNFVYQLEFPRRISSPEVGRLISKTNGMGLKDRVPYLLANDVEIRFLKVSGLELSKNLKMVDSNMAHYLGQILVRSFADGNLALKALIDATFDDLDEREHAAFKIRQFLGSVAMGLRPGKPWDGDVTKFKGYLVVTNTAEVLVYYLSNLQDFQELLFSQSKLERPSTSRHDYGTVYSDGERYLLNLNLQLRFSV